MLEKLKELQVELTKRELKAHQRMCRKKELNDPIETARQGGKFIAYRNAREMVETLIAEYEEDEWAEYDEPHYPFDEVGYDPYMGEYSMDL